VGSLIANVLEAEEFDPEANEEYSDSAVSNSEELEPLEDVEETTGTDIISLSIIKPFLKVIV
jgi:hypothetical protein